MIFSKIKICVKYTQIKRKLYFCVSFTQTKKHLFYSLKTNTIMEATTQKNRTRIYNLVILDESGSMESIKHAAISGFNETVGGIRAAQEKFVDTQEHFVSLLTFCECKKKMLYDKVPVADVKPLTDKEYRPCCCTPLFDAMGMALTKLSAEIKEMEDATAVVTVITDGLENASKEYDGHAVKELVRRLSEEEGWTFAYIGTNQNVQEVSASISISNYMYFEDNEEDMKRAWNRERNAKMRHFDELHNMVMACPDMTASERKSERIQHIRTRAFFMENNELADRITPERVDSLKQNEVFVFGSSAAGSHSGGAAAAAVKRFGAVVGQGEGLQGQSYAIPTTGCSRQETAQAVERFITFAKEHPEKTFLVTRIGCGKGGHSVQEMAEMFIYAGRQTNIHLPADFWEYIM